MVEYINNMNNNLKFIAGPCVIESAELLDTVARTLVDINRRLGTNIIFKASFDKANRTSINSFHLQVRWQTSFRFLHSFAGRPTYWLLQQRLVRR